MSVIYELVLDEESLKILEKLLKEEEEESSEETQQYLLMKVYVRFQAVKKLRNRASTRQSQLIMQSH